MGFDEKWANTSYQTASKAVKLSSNAFFLLKNNYPELNANYLFDGTGEMFLNAKNELSEPEQEYFTRNYFDIRTIIKELHDLRERVQKLEKRNK